LFLDMVATLFHVTTGQSLRTTELADLTYTNPNGVAIGNLDQSVSH